MDQTEINQLFAKFQLAVNRMPTRPERPMGKKELYWTAQWLFTAVSVYALHKMKSPELGDSLIFACCIAVLNYIDIYMADRAWDVELLGRARAVLQCGKKLVDEKLHHYGTYSSITLQPKYNLAYTLVSSVRDKNDAPILSAGSRGRDAVFQASVLVGWSGGHRRA